LGSDLGSDESRSGQDLSELDLVTAARGGDRRALGQLVRLYHEPLTAYLIRLGADRELALDLAQEAFCRVCARIGSLTNPAGFRVWLFRVAHNLFLDHQRSAYRRRVLVSDAGAQVPSGVGDDPVEAVAREEQGDRVRRAVGTLPPSLRSAVLLRYYHDLSLDEIARVTSVPVGTVKSRLHRALNALARLLAEGVEDGGALKVRFRARLSEDCEPVKGA